MAIEKNYLSTYGWEIPDAYYKVESYNKLEGTNEWVFTVKVHRNKATRDAGQDALASNTMKIPVSNDVDTSEVTTIKSLCSLASSRAAIPNVALVPILDQIFISLSLIFILTVYFIYSFFIH